MRRFGALFALLALGVFRPAPVQAQYFGQNKVQYGTFTFQVIRTEHFEVFFYERERAAALDAARMAERSYARLSRVLHHQFQGRKPIILYASPSDFQQTNAIQEDLGESIGGVTEPIKHRMVLPFTGDYSFLAHVLQHEMTHQFQFDVFAHGQIGAGLQQLQQIAPPLWYMEGMAEYMSLGPIDALTAMWLRDAALEGHLPTIEQMTFDPRIFPYHFGHALWAYIGERWGDEVIGDILQATPTSGVEGAFKRVLGRSLSDLSDDWRDAVQETFLPQLADHYRARRIAKPTLTEERSTGSLHLAPALSPDGKEIAFVSEGNSFFVDLYLADAETGRVKRRLIKSTINSNYESLRFINSAGSFSPDGKYFAIAVKHKDRDDLVLLDVERDREAGRIKVPLSGMTSPSWSPDGKQIVFTGYDGGMSDLFIVNADGTDLRRLTNDKYADLLPTWSPDGKTIAFTTDRGPETDFNTLKFGNMRIALYHLETGHIEVLDHMERGHNINPVWSPDGSSLIFSSDRTGIANMFMYDFSDSEIYQLTDVYTGVMGITPTSPCLSWAHSADRLAFVYYEDGVFNVYSVDNPRSLRRKPYEDPGKPLTMSLLAVTNRDTATTTPYLAAARHSRDSAETADSQRPNESNSIYRSANGLRTSGENPPATDTTTPQLSIRTLLDSATLSLPDTSEFSIHPYRTRFTTDFVARPTFGYERDNFGRGIFGGTSISLSDMLSNRTLVLGGSLNGRLSEAQVQALYLNQDRRLNWAFGVSQQPSYFYVPSTLGVVSSPGSTNNQAVLLTTRIRRLVIRDAFLAALYPTSRFDRFELSLHTVSVADATLEQSVYYDQKGSYLGVNNLQTIDAPSVAYVAPTLAFVHDNSLFSSVGPFSGARTRFQVAPAVGGWRFTGGLADVRKYFFARPFTLAFRGIYYGRFGRDAGEFPIFLGSTDLLRGYTANSLINHECVAQVTNYDALLGAVGAGGTGCHALDQLIGSRVAVANVEFRFPLTRTLSLGILPIGFPPIEGAIFYDVGMAWQNGSTLEFSPSQCRSFADCRAPLRSWGGSIRANFLGILIMRVDYTRPLDRAYDHPYWTLSIGPTF